MRHEIVLGKSVYDSLVTSSHGNWVHSVTTHRRILGLDSLYNPKVTHTEGQRSFVVPYPFLLYTLILSGIKFRTVTRTT